MKLRLLVLIIGVSLATFCGIRFEASQRAIPTGHHLERILDKVRKEYVDESVDVDDLYYDGLNEMLGRLDRNSRFIRPEDVERFDGETEGYFVGVGVVLSAFEDDYPSIQKVITGGPAERVGVQENDRIQEVAGIDVRGINLPQLKKQIKGPEGSTVELLLLRGDAEIRRSVERARVEVSSVSGIRLYEDGGHAPIGYIRLSQFQRGTAAEVQIACERLLEAGAESLILDLRQNVGGILVEGVQVTRLFARPGVILRTRGRDDNREYKCDYPGRFSEYNLVVLVDGGSASASEFVCAALQDQRRALLVGAESYGKWTVQSVLSIGRDSEDGILKLTTSSFHRSDPERVYRDENGKRRILPDVPVPVDDETTRHLYSAWQDEQISIINTPLEVVRHDRPSFDPEHENTVGPVVDAALIRAIAILDEPELYRHYLTGDPPSAPEGATETGEGDKSTVSTEDAKTHAQDGE